jgi:hypothetical protein
MSLEDNYEVIPGKIGQTIRTFFLGVDKHGNESPVSIDHPQHLRLSGEALASSVRMVLKLNERKGKSSLGFVSLTPISKARFEELEAASKQTGIKPSTFSNTKP